MEDTERRSAFVGALTTEHYVLQSAAGTAITEGGARATAFILTVSSSMVAIGFTVGNSWVFWPFVSAVLPLLFGLGLITTVRLVETGAQSLMYQRAIVRIRRFYRQLDQENAEYFGQYSRHPDPADATEALAMLAVRRKPELFSIATTTGLITAGIGAIGTALVVIRVAGTDALLLAYCTGGAALVALLTVFFWFERRQYRDALRDA
ncbi:hypothetical protein [Kribbella deserti]|uniref:ABC transporter ATP-binding protein n=1 Tax=Kribbella deserti TaxID=1926257 RepID=A0ABV6QIN5_9ACTN